jgi:hypothetical protein
VILYCVVFVTSLIFCEYIISYIRCHGNAVRGFCVLRDMSVCVVITVAEVMVLRDFRHYMIIIIHL